MTSLEADARSAALDDASVYAEALPKLVAFLTRLVGLRAVAEELAQEAGIRLIRAMRGEQIEDARGFLFHVATNLARDHLRRAAIERHGADEIASRHHSSDAGTDHVASAREELARVARVVAKMPPRPRAVFVLARVEGLSQKQIAARLGIAPKTVENHLTRALAMLARAMADRTSS